MSSHTPTRPAWACTGCGTPWPCVTRRRELLAEFGDAWISLHINLGSLMWDAAADLPDLRSGELYTRFLYRVRQAQRQGVWPG